MHLGPEAMKMIGVGIAQDISGNRGNAWFAHEHGGESIISSRSVSGGAVPIPESQ